MTPEIPALPLPIPEDLRDIAAELYEYLRSIASEKGTLFFTPDEVTRMFDDGEEALTLLCDAGLVVYEITNHYARAMWKLPQLIELRGL